MEQKALKLIMAGLLILSMALTGREAAEYVGAMHAVNALRETGMGADDSGRLCVVVDAGHGGDDPVYRHEGQHQIFVQLYCLRRSQVVCNDDHRFPGCVNPGGPASEHA